MSRNGTIKTDVVIFGAGIAGLWAFHHMKSLGYSAVLLEHDEIGSGQTLTSQGIIHSGLRYILAGKINKLAKSMSAMPEVWLKALKGEGAVNLSQADLLTESQFLMIPQGIKGDLIKFAAKSLFGQSIGECAPEKWPEEIKNSGFNGHLIYIDELVIDMPLTLRALVTPYKDFVRKIDMSEVGFDSSTEGIDRIHIGHKIIEARYVLFTAAESNQDIASMLGHDTELSTQKRPLVQGMMKNAPYPLFAHLIGSMDKPVATITTHVCADGSLVWYVGGAAAEHNLDAPSSDIYDAIQSALKDYMPLLNLDRFMWSTCPIDRIEGASHMKGWLPDTPVIHQVGNAFYCWPTQATFAPMLCEMLLEKMDGPTYEQAKFSFLPKAEFAQAPWDRAIWEKPSIHAQAA